MSRWLVTGSLGALGRAVMACLQSQGESIVGADHRSGGTETLHWDVTDPNQTQSVLSDLRPNFILHLAATFTQDMDSAYSINVLSSRLILETVDRLGLDTRVVLIGSAAEYGVVRPEENPILVEHTLSPVSVYGMSKAWQTMMAGIFAARKVNVLVTRIFNLNGPGMSEALFVGRVRRQAEELLAGKRHRIQVGSLSAVRDYLSTDEAALQVTTLARRGAAGKVYHVASGLPVTMNEMLNRLLTEYGLDQSVVDTAPALSNHKGYDTPVMYADMSATRFFLQNGDVT